MTRLARACFALLLLTASTGCASAPSASRTDSAVPADTSRAVPADASLDVPVDASLDASADARLDAPITDAVSSDLGVRCAAGLTRCGESCIDLASSASHCGACGRVCDIAHATADCASGACRLATCDEGFADCNGDPADGCEVDLLTDTSHCGACATRCAFAHAAATCEGGACVMNACDAPFADCDGRADDGCEVDLTRSVAHCGACAAQCELPGAGAALCTAGVCVIGVCDTGRADCDGDAANGCETALNGERSQCSARGRAYAYDETCASGVCVRSCATSQKRCGSDCIDLRVDPRNCGACGRACAVANGVAGCAAGVCTVAACNAGRADCDRSAANGCEVDVTRSLSNCGVCGRVCAVANGAASCVSGRCEIATCNPGRGDCNRAPADGCEVDLSNSASNCGACGNRCGAGLVCRGGRCECDTPRGSPGTFSRTVRAGVQERSDQQPEHDYHAGHDQTKRLDRVG